MKVYALLLQTHLLERQAPVTEEKCWDLEEMSPEGLVIMRKVMVTENASFRVINGGTSEPVGRSTFLEYFDEVLKELPTK